MEDNYALEWFDMIITVSLNPQKSDIAAITDQQAEDIILRARQEKEKLQSLLKAQVFNLRKKSRIELLLKQYHTALIILLDEAFKNQKFSTKSPASKKIFKELITCLDEFLSFIEIRFSAYLSLSERVPVTYLLITKKEFKLRSDRLKNALHAVVNDGNLIEIILGTICSFTDKPKDDPVTFKEVSYYRELITELEKLKITEQGSCMELNELLIYLNFNNRAFLNHYTQKLAEKINGFESIKEKFEQLLYYFKIFNQMQNKPDAALDHKNGDLKTVLGNWFTNEIFYLEKKLQISFIPLQEGLAAAKETAKTPKILTDLTVDQIAIIIRAAEELKLIRARSLNEAFKLIVPHLSTLYKENISADSMRSKSYAAESRDADIAVQALERMIKKIKDY